jgi:beta-hydroxylase
MKWLAIGVYVLAVLYIHFRGKVRLPLKAQLVDHSTLMAPINVLMHMFSRVPNTPFVPLTELPELAPLQRNWRVIRAEAESLLALKKIKAAGPNDDPNFSAFVKRGWKYFFLKWYDAIHPSAQRLCPQTFELLQSIPSIKVATFAELPAGGKLSQHRDPFAGWLRYHLGLATPNDEGCFIEVDGQRYTWRDGQALIFDETYIHWANNSSDDGRIVLLCDIERPMRFRWSQSISNLLGRLLMTATSPPNEKEDEQQGLAGQVFRALHYLGHYRRQFKAWSMAAYKLTVIVFVAGLAALLYRL